MKVLNTIQSLSFIVLGVLTLFILGAEPSGSEESYYEYEHFCDKGHLGWYMCWGWVLCLVLSIVSTIIIYNKLKNKSK